MADRAITVSPVVRRRAESLGQLGVDWLRRLPDLVADLEQRWGIRIGPELTGGTAAYVARAQTADRDEVVIKIVVPDPDFTRQVRTIRRAAGRAYVELLEADLSRGAVLMEALGPSMDMVGWSPESQLAALGDLLLEAWRVRSAGEPAVNKAQSLGALVNRLWEQLDGPCPRAIVDTALLFAHRRAEDFDPARCVIVHGDPAPANAARVRTARAGAPHDFVFVDPDGFRGDPAYDLGVVLRDWCPQLLAGDAPVVARRYCGLLARRSGFDQNAIWEWGFLERVSTGLFALSLGADELGRPMLRTAELLL